MKKTTETQKTSIELFEQSVMKEINSKLRQVFASLKDRCNNPNNERYKDYGGRGIKVCPQWNISKSKPFVDWAMSSGYEPGLQLDRKENDLGYSPENCRWVIEKTQSRNRRDNRPIEHNGVYYTTITELIEFYHPGCSNKFLSAIFHRISRYGWSVEVALTKPINHPTK